MTQNAKNKVAAKFNDIVAVGDFVDEFIEAIGDACEPEDVFSEDQLNTWAEANGFVKE